MNHRFISLILKLQSHYITSASKAKTFRRVINEKLDAYKIHMPTELVPHDSHCRKFFYQVPMQTEKGDTGISVLTFLKYNQNKKRICSQDESSSKYAKKPQEQIQGYLHFFHLFCCIIFFHLPPFAIFLVLQEKLMY